MSIDSVYAEAYVRLAHLTHSTPEHHPRRTVAKIASLLAGVALIGVIDYSNTNIDTCIYSIDGARSRSEMLRIHPDGFINFVNGDCTPSITFNQE